VELVAHEVRTVDARRQIESLPIGERIALVLRTAEAGDMIPLLACERSYSPIVPADVLKEARQRLGAALNRPAAEAVKAGQRKLALAQRFAAIARGAVGQRVRSFDGQRVSN
jgi:hypothetical protein